jgi:hypothetical protein
VLTTSSADGDPLLLVYIIVGAVLCLCVVLAILAIGILIGRRDRDAEKQLANDDASPEMSSAYDAGSDRPNYGSLSVANESDGYAALPSPAASQPASDYADLSMLPSGSGASEEYGDVLRREPGECKSHVNDAVVLLR